MTVTCLSDHRLIGCQSSRLETKEKLNNNGFMLIHRKLS